MSDTASRITRRGLLAAAAGTTAAFALPQSGGSPVMAAAPMMGVHRPSFYRFRLGEFEVVTFLDGAVQRDGPHPIFGKDQKPETVHELLEENFLPPTRFENPYVPALVNTGKELVLFDTGNGPLRRGKGAGLLASLLKDAGYSPEQIDVVVITHGHPDHIGGLLEDNKPGFPNARYVFGAAEFDYWRKGENIPDPRKKTQALFAEIAVPFGEKATMIAPGDDVVTGIRSMETFGHSPGHMSFHVESGSSQLLIWADVCNHYVVSLQRPDWEVAFDHDKAMAAATRKKVFDMVNTDRIPVVGHHMPFPGVGYLDRHGNGYHWVAAGYQLNL